MKTLQAAFAGMLLLGSAYVHAQTADEVVNKHIAAVGGANVIGSIKTITLEGELIANGTTFTNKVYAISGKAFKSEVTLPEQQISILECITTDGGWTLNPFAGMTEAQPMPADRVKAAQGDLDIGGKLYKYKEKGSTVELAGNESVDGVNTIKLKLKDKEGKETMYYLDPTSYYILKAETSTTGPDGQAVSIVSNFSDYRKTDIGYVVAFKRVRNVGMEIVNNINKVEFNKEIDPKVFEMPK
ncbi:MAG TPA: hypothetical protein VD993_19515 [Chitinophagaceae bacterium]|nr:hypothetical protein [Chitinophagaceae bacterium]